MDNDYYMLRVQSHKSQTVVTTILVSRLRNTHLHPHTHTDTHGPVPDGGLSLPPQSEIMCAKSKSSLASRSVSKPHMYRSTWLTTVMIYIDIYKYRLSGWSSTTSRISYIYAAVNTIDNRYIFNVTYLFADFV